MECPIMECPNCGDSLWLDDEEMGGLHCRRCDEWFYEQDEEDQMQAMYGDLLEEDTLVEEIQQG